MFDNFSSFIDYYYYYSLQNLKATQINLRSTRADNFVV